MTKFEPMPRNSFPKDLQQFPDLVASEIYKYQAVSRGPARIFNIEYENTLRDPTDKKKRAFCLPAIVLFFAKAAAEGVIGGFAYAAVVKAVSTVRKTHKRISSHEVKI